MASVWQPSPSRTRHESLLGCNKYRREVGGDLSATELVDDAATKSGIARLEQTAAGLSDGAAAPIATNIRLIGVCMQAFPDILTGQALTCTSL